MRTVLLSTASAVSLLAVLGSTAQASTITTISASPTSLDFGYVLVGTQSQPESASVTNSGANPVTVTLTASGQFATSESSLKIGGYGTASDDVTFKPTTTGTSTGKLSVNGKSAGSASVILSGSGVAPKNSVSVTKNAPVTRIGTSSTATVTITNTGNGSLAGGVDSTANPIYLHGTVNQAPAGSDFALTGGAPVAVDLADAAAVMNNLATTNKQVVSYTYTPTRHGKESTSVSIDFSNGSTNGKNAPQPGVTEPLSGTGVGPTYASPDVAPDGTIDFGQVRIGKTATYHLRISNDSMDQPSNSLTELTLLSQDLSGDHAFRLGNNLQGKVVNKGTFTDLLLEYTPVAYGFDTASLTIGTDQDAAFGMKGDSFTYALEGVAVPEPASFAVLGSGLLGFSLLRRRTDRRSA